MPRARLLLVCCLTLLAGTVSLGADAAWTLTTADFETRSVEVLSLDDTRASLRTDKGQSLSLPLDDVLQLQRTIVSSAQESPAVSSANFSLLLSTGDSLSGEPLAVKDEQLTWKSPSIGQLSIPMRQIAAIAKPNQMLANLDEARLEDSIRLANGDVLKGIVTSLDASAAKVQVSGGDETPVPMESITAIYFASAGRAKAAPSRAFRLRTTDNSTIVAPKLSWTGSSISLTLVDGTTRKLDASKVVAVEQLNGPVSWLSSREPIENIQTPFLGEPWPARMDKSVRGEPIRFGDRQFTHGIGVHSYSKLVYAIDPAEGWRSFRTSYAMDGDLPYADVTVRIRVDDKVVHEQAGFKSGVLAPTASIDLTGAKTLTLEVDYGASYDTQDRFNWIEPALLKRSLATTTQPAAKRDAAAAPAAP